MLIKAVLALISAELQISISRGKNNSDDDIVTASVNEYFNMLNMYNSYASNFYHNLAAS